jgi:hypothetical protein
VHRKCYPIANELSEEKNVSEIEKGITHHFDVESELGFMEETTQPTETTMPTEPVPDETGDGT